jgi:ketosteroid isomerase-like protein
MNEQANIDLMKQAYDAFNKGDIQRLLGVFASDIEWTLPEVEGIPFSGKRRGIAQVEEFFRVMDQCQQAREFTPDEYIAQGDRVVVLGHCTFTVKATGTDYDDQWSHVFTISGGKVTRFTEYSDTHRAALAYQPQAAIAARGAAAGAGAGRPPVH